MADDDLNLDDWLHKNISWMVQETYQYFDTRELLMLCQTVAVMRLNQTLEKLCQTREADNKKERPKPAPAKKPAK
ncbi:MAG: hypothetical protein V1806_17765 [Pseudomonadota bacterium]